MNQTGITDVFVSARVALIAGGLISERLIGAREQAQRGRAGRERTAGSQGCKDAERAAARAWLAPLGCDGWRERTPVEDLSRASRAGKDIDADAPETGDRMREQLRSRYDVDGERAAVVRRAARAGAWGRGEAHC